MKHSASGMWREGNTCNYLCNWKLITIIWKAFRWHPGKPSRVKLRRTAIVGIGHFLRKILKWHLIYLKCIFKKQLCKKNQGQDLASAMDRYTTTWGEKTIKTTTNPMKRMCVIKRYCRAQILYLCVTILCSLNTPANRSINSGLGRPCYILTRHYANARDWINLLMLMCVIIYVEDLNFDWSKQDHWCFRAWMTVVNELGYRNKTFILLLCASPVHVYTTIRK